MKKLCVIGDPISYSMSPVIHNAVIRAMGLKNIYYEKIRVKKEDLGNFIISMRKNGIIGMNITHPHKETVIKYLDQLTDEAKKIGAVNTVFMKDGMLFGANTDVTGFLRSLHENFIDIKDKKVLILGAGGAAKAVVSAVFNDAGSIVILNRTIERAEEISEKTGKRIRAGGLNEIEEEIEETEILINCTPLGMKGVYENISPVDPEILNSDITVIDTVYNPVKTKLLREAEKRGSRTINGIEMFIHQAAESLRIWTGKDPPINVMRDSLRRCLIEHSSYRFYGNR